MQSNASKWLDLNSSFYSSFLKKSALRKVVRFQNINFICLHLRLVCNQWQPGTTTVPSTSALGRFLWAMVAANYGAPGCTAAVSRDHQRRTIALALADDIHLDGRPCCTTSRGRRSGHPGGGAGAGVHCDAYRRYGGGSPGL